MLIEAHTMRTANRSIRAVPLPRAKVPADQMGSGMAGIRTLRVKYTAAIEGSPNQRAVLKSISPALALGTMLARAVAPTMNREYAVASTALTPKR